MIKFLPLELHAWSLIRVTHIRSGFTRQSCEPSTGFNNVCDRPQCSPLNVLVNRAGAPYLFPLIFISHALDPGQLFFCVFTILTTRAGGGACCLLSRGGLCIGIEVQLDLLEAKFLRYRILPWSFASAHVHPANPIAYHSENDHHKEQKGCECKRNNDAQNQVETSFSRRFIWLGAG